MIGQVSSLGPYGRIVYGLTMAAMSAITVFGYAMFLRAIWGRRELQKRSIFLMSLCVSDLLVVFGHVFATVAASFHSSWPFGDLACQVNAFFGIGPTLVSIGSIALIAYDTYNKECKKSNDCVNYGFYVAAVWASGLAAGFLPMVGFGSYGFESKLRIACLLEFDNTGIVAFIALLSLVWFALPMYLLLKYYGKVKEETGNGMLLKVVPTQMLCSWTPYAASSALILLLGPSNLPLMPMSIISNLCAKLCIATNPFIYILSDRDLRVACSKLFCGEMTKTSVHEDAQSQTDHKEKSS